MRLASTLMCLLLIGCSADTADPVDLESPDYFEGASFDEGRRDAPPGFDKADIPSPYLTPELPELSRPEIVVSLEGLTVHLFDRATGFNRVYPVGPGVLGRNGRSITPTGHYETGPDTADRWWYIPNRWDPEYFEGYPFLRLTIENSRGYNTYGFHGPITNPLRRDYVSHGCMRMEKTQIVELFTAVRTHPSTPVTIQQEVELDANGERVDVGDEPALYAVGEPLVYGDSVGPREEPVLEGFVGDACDSDADCGDGADGYFCHEAGFCSTECAGYCPDRAGYASTFCVEDPSRPETGMCVQRVDGRNATCALIPGSFPDMAARFVADSGVAPATAMVCAPFEDAAP
ncbi:MAG: L,D-transpeptidase [Sandaracinaceae bacterium]